MLLISIAVSDKETGHHAAFLVALRSLTRWHPSLTHTLVSGTRAANTHQAAQHRERVSYRQPNEGISALEASALMLYAYSFYCFRILSCVVANKNRASTAAVEDEGTTLHVHVDEHRAEPGFCRWSVIAMGLGVSLAPLASVRRDVTGPRYACPKVLLSNCRNDERSKPHKNPARSINGLGEKRLLFSRSNASG